MAMFVTRRFPVPIGLVLLALSAASALTSEDCYNSTWQVIRGQHSTGSTQHTGPQNVVECLDYCRNTPGCLAVDVDMESYPPGCWPHFDASYNLTDNIYPKSNTDQYRLESRCSGLVSQVCTKSTWEKYVGMAAFGAQQYLGPRTIQQCLDYCENTSGCVAVDVNVTAVPLTCWPHLASSEIIPANVYPQPGTNFYRLANTCTTPRPASGCYNPTWRVIEGRTSVGSEVYPGPQSVQECLDACGNLPSCVAADFNFRTTQCWLLTKAGVDLNDLYGQEGVNEYQVVTRCANDSIAASSTTGASSTTSFVTGSGCTRSAWQKQADTSSQYGQLSVGPRTIRQCQQLCEWTAGCVGVDIDVNVVPLQCWMHLSAADLTDNFDQSGTDQYRLTYWCPNNVSDAACYNPEWRELVDETSAGASEYPGPRSVQECLDACGQRLDCQAADFNFIEKSCWLYTGAGVDLSKTFPQPGVHEYRLVDRCANGSITTSTTSASTTVTASRSCTRSRWEILRDASSTNGLLFVGPRTIDQCLEHCENTSGCVAVDVDVNLVPLQCWVHRNASELVTFYSQTGTNQYRLLGKCPNATRVNTNYNPEWSPAMKDSNSMNAHQVAGQFSVQECLDECGKVDACLAVDYGVDAKSCWLHTDQADLTTVYDQPGTDQYRLAQRHAVGGITVSVASSTAASTTTTLPTGGSCTRSVWRKMADSSSLNGVKVEGLRTIRQCQDRCERTPGCLAVDVDVNVLPLVCWIHTNQVDLNDVYNQRGTDQYQLVYRCPNATLGGGACYNPEWKILANAVSIGAVHLSGSWSLQECLDECGKLSGCLAVDYDSTNRACWLHTNSVDLNDLYDQPGTNQYRLFDRCSDAGNTGPSCTRSTWTKTVNATSTNGVRVTGIRTIAQCLDQCLSDARCVAVDVDVDVQPIGCWLHRNAADIIDPYYQPGTDQYRIQYRCPNPAPKASCFSPEWQVYADQSSLGSTRLIGPQSLQECLEECGQYSICVAVDFSSWDRSCWMYTARDDLTMYRQPGASHYRLMNRCTNGTDAVASQSTTTTTTAAPVTGADCKSSTWSTRKGWHSIGGVKYNGARSIGQCKALCEWTSNCVAVDVDVTIVPPNCWLHVDQTNEFLDQNMYNDETDINHYRLLYRCANPSPTPCFNPSWSIKTDQNSLGGGQVPGSFAIQECLDECGKTTSCVAADYGRLDGSCWLHTDTNSLLEVYDQPGTDQYRLEERCSPAAINMTPYYGPLAGSTTVTISSAYVNMLDVDYVLFGGRKLAPAINTRTPNSVVIVTPPSVNTTSVTVILVSTDNRKFEATVRFEYRSNPVITNITPITPTEHLIDGGTVVTINGFNLNSVAEPRMTLSAVAFNWSYGINYRAMSTQTSRKACWIPADNADGQVLLCQMPAVVLPSGFDWLLQSGSDIPGITGTEGSGVASLVRGQARLDVYVGLKLDGFTAYENISTSHSEIKIQFYRRPKITCSPRIIYEPAHDLYISFMGSELLKGCQSSDYAVTVGDAPCSDVRVLQDEIRCTPPAAVPDVGKDSFCSDNTLPARIQLGYGVYNCTCVYYIVPSTDVPTYADTGAVRRIGLGLGIGLGIPLLILIVVVVVLTLLMVRRDRLMTLLETSAPPHPVEAVNMAYESWEKKPQAHQPPSSPSSAFDDTASSIADSEAKLEP